MTNKKTTKRALTASIVSLMLCFTMLLGTTYAWFTDSVTSTNNIIKAGNLDIELEYWNGTAYEKVTDTTELFDNEALWEPGHTEVAYLKISNIGSLALKYQLNVNVVKETVGKTVKNEDLKLSEHLVFSVVDKEITTSDDLYTRQTAIDAAGDVKGLKTYNGETKALVNTGDADYVALIIYMPESVGNEANHNGKDVPSIEMGVNLLATQYAHEEDSFDNTYDENTEIVTTVGTLDQLANALKIGGKIVLEKDITIPKEALTNDPEVASIPYGLAILGKDAVIDLNGNDIEIDAQDGVALFVKDGTLTIKGEGNVSNVGTSGYVVWAKGASTVNVESGDFFAGGDDTTLFYASGNVAYDPNSPWATINIYGGTFENEAVGDSVQDYLNVMNHGVGRINIYGGTFDFDPVNTKWGDDAKYITVGKGYSVTDNGNGTWTVGMSNESLNEAIANGAAEVVLADGEYTLPTALNNTSLVANGDVSVTVGNSDETVVLGDNVTLKGITFANNRTNDSGVVKATGENITIEGCNFELVGNSVGVGIGVDGTSVTVKDCTFKGGYKGIGHASGNNYSLTVDNCTFDDADSVYGIHVNSVKGDIVIKNSKVGLFNTFFGYEDESRNTGVLRFENCEFVYVEGKTNVVKLYRDAEFVNCTFEDGFLFSGAYDNQDADWTFTNCTYGDGTVKEHFLNDTFSCNVTAVFDGETWNWDKTAKTWTKQ